MNIEVGKIYEFIHQRKGKFTARVVELSPLVDGDLDRTAELAIQTGAAKYLNRDDARAGDVITIRLQLCSWKPAGEP